MNSRRKLPWKWWTQYHIQTRKTANDNIELEWLKAVRTKKIRVVPKNTRHFSYFVTQNARHSFAAVVVSLVIRCRLHYYVYHVVLQLSLLAENKMLVPSLLARVSGYLWRNPHIIFPFVRVGCFLPWCRSWSHSRKQPPIKLSKPNWWSQQSWLGKALNVVDVFKNV